MGWKRLRVCRRGNDACSLDFLLERQGIESEEPLRYEQILIERLRIVKQGLGRALGDNEERSPLEVPR